MSSARAKFFLGKVLCQMPHKGESTQKFEKVLCQIAHTGQRLKKYCARCRPIGKFFESVKKFLAKAKNPDQNRPENKFKIILDISSYRPYLECSSLTYFVSRGLRHALSGLPGYTGYNCAYRERLSSGSF